MGALLCETLFICFRAISGHLPESLHDSFEQDVLNSLRIKRKLKQLSYISAAETITIDESWPRQRLMELEPIKRVTCSDVVELASRDEKRSVFARLTPPEVLREGECEIYPSLSRDRIEFLSTRTCPAVTSVNDRTHMTQACRQPTHAYSALCVATFGSSHFDVVRIVLHE